MNSNEIVIFDVVEVSGQDPIERRAPRDRMRSGETTRSGAAQMHAGVQAMTVGLDQLGDNLVDFIDKVGVMLARVGERERKFRVEKVEVQAQVSAQGQVGFMGTGAKAGGGASLKIVLERRKDPVPENEAS